MRVLLLFIYLGAARSAQVTRCCGPGSSLLLTPSPHCAPVSTGSRSLPSVSGLELSGDRREVVEVSLQEEGVGLPSCGQGLQVHRLGQGQEDVEGWVTSDGQLVTAKYEAEFPHGEFCVDYNSTGIVVVAVMCDPCKGQLTCLSLCCPHGQAMVDGPDFSLVCQEQPGGVSYSPQVWDKAEETLLNWERNQHYILVAPPMRKKGSNSTEGFHCPQNRKDSLTRLWAEQDQGQYRVRGDGSLLGIGLPDYISDAGGLATKNESWSPGEFCLVVGSPPDYSSYDYSEEGGDQQGLELVEGGGQELVETFMTCYDTDPYNWCTEFTTFFHPTGLCISILFLLLTLAAYVFEPSLRDQLMGKMTIIFICNLTICFIVAVLSWFQVSEHGTGGCSASGYLIQYFFLAFFFWLNSLAWHIYLPFSSLGLAARIHRATERSRLLICCLYAQGTPLLVCAITALIDASRQDLSQAQRLYYPNMGVYRCFLGAQRTHPTRSYFVQPDFIYFHSVVLLLQLSNLCLLATSLRHLCSHSGGDLRQKMHDNVGRFVKFFVILGFYWTGDFLSTALAAEYGEVRTCAWRIVADLGGLFSGVLIFVVLICNKPVLTSILHRTKGLKPGSEEQQEMEETRVEQSDLH